MTMEQIGKESNWEVSVVIPTYNREKYIGECLKSIVNQTLPPIEVIVVDDCSTDDTIRVINELKTQEAKYSIIRVVNLEKKGGAQVARNRGIMESKTDWIAFCDSDDIWLPNKLELQIDRLQKSNRGICAGGGLIQKKGKIVDSKWIEGDSGYIFKEVVTGKTYIMFQALLVKKDILMDIGLLDENVPSYQEYDTAIRLAKEYEIEYIKEALFVYNMHEDETISKCPKKKIEGRRYLFYKHRRLVKKELKNLGMRQWYDLIASTYSACSIRHWIYLGGPDFMVQ